MKKLSRREFIATAAKAGAALPAAGAAVAILSSLPENFPGAGCVAKAAVKNERIFYTKDAAFYDKLKNKTVRCGVCPRKCEVGDQERGFCGNKENRGGKYYTLAWGNPCAAHTDPIEKKPLFHFLPATTAFSIAAAGCNFDCKFCQNWDISQSRPEQTRNYKMPPGDVAKYAKQTGAKSVAYTYSEPVVFYEYVRDSAAAVHAAGLRNVMVSNGYINPKPFKELCRGLDAVKIDFKAFSGKFYKQTCLGELKPVLDAMPIVLSSGKWLELVTLIVPTLNDKASEIRALAKWTLKNLGPNVPLHFSRFSPMYKLKNLQPTPVATLDMAYKICRDEGINYVYVGNVPGHQGEKTFCHNCHKLIIDRYGFTVSSFKLKGGRCEFCKTKIPGVWA